MGRGSAGNGGVDRVSNGGAYEAGRLGRHIRMENRTGR